MNSALVVDLSVSFTINSPFWDFFLSDNLTSLTYDLTFGFKPFTKKKKRILNNIGPEIASGVSKKCTPGLSVACLHCAAKGSSNIVQ